MKKFEGCLICTDLDGTLFRSDKTVSKENIDAIEYFKSEGGFFTFVTGRMPFFSQTAYEVIQPNAPFGCVNGGALFDHRTQKYVWQTPLEPSALTLAAYVLERAEDVGLQINSFEHTYFCRENSTMESFRQLTGVPNLTCTLDGIDEPMAKILFGDERDEVILKIAALLAEHPLAEQFDFIRSEHSLYEILPKGISKGTALAKLVEYLFIDGKRTIAIGDYHNDIGMFREAGIGIAVSNACEEAKKAADRVTVSNEEHAIARVIADLDSGTLVL